MPANNEVGIKFADGTFQYTAATGFDSNNKTLISGITIRDEGNLILSSANTVNFVGTGVVASNVGGVATITIGGGVPAGNVTEVQFNDGGVFGASANLTFDKTTGDLFVGGSVNAYKELQVGVTTNRANTPTLDDWGRMRMFAANTSTSTAYGFYFSYNDTSYGMGPHFAITNEHQTWNQAIILGDTVIGDEGVLFGVSAATIPSSQPTTGYEPGWQKAFYITGQSTFLPLLQSGATGNILYVDTANDNKLTYGPPLGIRVQEEGSNVVTSATVFNFIGSSVTASNVGGVATITVANSGISGITIKDEGSTVLSSANTINFVGSGVIASNVNGVATITIQPTDANNLPFISGVTIQDEGNLVLSSANTINFVGAGVVASNANGVATITITNVDSNNRPLISGITVQEEGSNVVTSATVFNFIGSTVTASNVGGVATINVTTTSSSSNAAIKVSDEGSTIVATATEINFVGAGVTTTNVGGVATVTIPGAGSSSVDVQDEGSAVISNPTAFNFVGAGVTATSVGTVATITIPNTGGTSSFGDYFPTGDWGTVTDPEFTAFGEELTVMYDCRWEPITPRNYLLQKDFGYVP
jgi:hypothetical protein